MAINNISGTYRTANTFAAPKVKASEEGLFKPMSGKVSGAMSDEYIRPLSKLYKPVKVTDTGDQREAKSKAVPAIAVTLRQDAESLHVADRVLHQNALTGNYAAFSTLLLCQWMLLGAFWGQAGIGVQIRKPPISSIRFQQRFRQNMHAGFLEQPKIMFPAIGKGQCNNAPIFQVYQHLRLYRVPLFLAGIVPFLLFLGRSIGVSVASTRITSYSMSLFSGALRPGREKVPSRINVSSTHLIPR